MKESIGKPTEERVLKSAAGLICEYLKQERRQIPLRKVSLLGSNPARVTRMVVDVGIGLRKHNFQVFSQEVPGSQVIDADDYYLRGLAKEYSREFYCPANRARELIVVDGESTEQRDRFMNHLRGFVDVFVMPREQSPCKDLGYVISFSDI